MFKLLLGVFIEVFVAVSLAGIVLALLIPVLNRSGSAGAGDRAGIVVIVGVLMAAVAIAVFRPGSVVRRYVKR